MYRKKSIRVISLVIALCLILTSTAFAYSQKGASKLNNSKNYNNWNKYALYMKNKGIMKGYDNGDFGFQDYVKRGDVTVMIVRAFQISTILGDIEKRFPDVPVDSYYYEAVATAKHYGIAKGDGWHFNPKNYVTIGEAIALIERSVKVANKNVVFDKDADLGKLYSGKDLEKYATRDDIAKMLYYILTGDEYFDEDEDVNKDKNIVVYETKKDVNVVFEEDDFYDAFYYLKNVDKKDKLDYIKFTLPSSSNGKLYYDYKNSDGYEVKSTHKYYYEPEDSSDRSIYKVAFVPNTKYTGTFYIDYRAYDKDGDSYDGKVKITVKDSVASLETIKYEIKRNSFVTFSYRDFKNVFSAAKKTFDYVKFVLPSEKYGKLYYDYESSSNYKSLVSEKKEYDYDDIDEITFVPESGYTGTFDIEYTAYDTDRNSYAGKITVTVKYEAVKAETISYTVKKDSKVNFDSDDFEDVLDMGDDDFDYVKFAIPDAEQGILYYDYDAKSSSDVKVKNNTKYDFDDIDEITFVPKSGFTGKLYIDYTAYDIYGNEYQGRIKITVTN